MDTTEDYIKMSEKAEEIQENWDRLLGDWVYSKILKKIIIFNRQTSSSNYSIAYTTEGETQIMTQEEWDKNKNVWLPRQDQLLDMWKAPSSSLVIYDLYHWLYSDRTCDIVDNSRETIMLAFVMDKKYQKHWNGKEWVKNG